MVRKTNAQKVLEAAAAEAIAQAQEALEAVAQAEESTYVKLSNSKVPVKYKKAYGKKQRCGDALSEAMAEATTSQDRKTDMNAVYAVAAANGIDMAKYASLNPGMQRMNLGNRLRGLMSQGKAVVIGTKTIRPAAAE